MVSQIIGTLLREAVGNKVELHKYVLTFEILGIIENLPYKCCNLLNYNVTYGKIIY